jgi:ubiquinone/menaquinone biosynthesis C-methylase UbiE
MKKAINRAQNKKMFFKSWKERSEKFYSHWNRGFPENQIQLAFRNHWDVFQELLKSKHFNKGIRVLEVGCGRGSISAYFSDAGYDCTLLDISPEAINLAKRFFRKRNLKANFKVGDVNNMPFEDNSRDIVLSIGLLEHFSDIENPIKEQIRVLDKGGIFIGYIVPANKNNVQIDYDWVNRILNGYDSRKFKKNKKCSNSKEKLFRSNFDSSKYLKVMKKLGLKYLKSSGIYSLPMISHSIDFPFSLMPEESEKVIVEHFVNILNERKKNSRRNPWLCKEGFGNAFLVWGFK